MIRGRITRIGITWKVEFTYRKSLLIILSFLLLTPPLFGQSKEKPCYVSVTSSDDFNQTLLSNISISVISQYLKNVKPFPSSGLSGKGHCIYEVTATLDGNKTFVTLQGNNLNFFGGASIIFHVLFIPVIL